MQFKEEHVFLLVVASVAFVGILSLVFFNPTGQNLTGFLLEAKVLCVLDCADDEIEKIYPEIYEINKNIYGLTQQIAFMNQQIKERKQLVKKLKIREEKFQLIDEIKILEQQKADLAEDVYFLQRDEELVYEESIDVCIQQCSIKLPINSSQTGNSTQTSNSTQNNSVHSL